MSVLAAQGDRRVVLVTRRTRLDHLIARYNTLGQAKFYVEHLGADFSDYLTESEAYAASLRVTVQALQSWGRYQIVDRSLLANFVFAPSDIVVALGQDGLVANTMKYLEGQPLVGLNPEPSRWDGVLLPFQPADLGAILPGIAADQRDTRSVTMAEARLSDGQVLRNSRAEARTGKQIAADLTDVFDGYAGAARRVARTAGLQVATQTQLAVSEQIPDMVAGYELNTVLDERVRPEHRAAHGRRFYRVPKAGQRGMNEMPQPPIWGGQVAWNCRCFLVPIIEIDGEEV